jgi:hypothetical protein
MKAEDKKVISRRKFTPYKTAAHQKGGWRAAAPQTPQNQNQINRICRHDDVKCFTLLTFQPKSATEIG